MQSEFFVPGKDILSVAVEIGNEKCLRKLNQNEPLTEIVQALCTEFHLSKDSGMYALQFMEDDAGGENKYVTEENRNEIKNGSILRLVLSPSECVKLIVKRIHPSVSDAEGKSWALAKLSTLSADPVFAKAFIDSSGYKKIIEMILDASESAGYITYCLRSMTRFVQHHLIHSLEDKVVKRLVELVNSDQHFPMELIECCLVLLKKTVKQNEHVILGIGIPDIIQHLWNRESPVVQEKTLALINALAQGKDSTKILGMMVSRQIRDTIQQNIVNFEVTPAMAHELYIYQSLILGLEEKNFKTKIEPSGEDATAIEEISSILTSADEDMQNMGGSILSLTDEAPNIVLLEKDMSAAVTKKKTFFKDEFVYSSPQSTNISRKANYVRSKSTPLLSEQQAKKQVRRSLMIDFSEGTSMSTPICKLTLNCILHFAKRYRRTFVRVVMEEEALSLKFPSTCEDLVKLLCEILGIGRIPSCDGKIYQPMVFTATSESPFIEELFCRASLLLGRTRREMKARTPNDLRKVRCQFFNYKSIYRLNFTSSCTLAFINPSDLTSVFCTDSWDFV